MCVMHAANQFQWQISSIVQKARAKIKTKNPKHKNSNRYMQRQTHNFRINSISREMNDFVHLLLYFFFFFFLGWSVWISFVVVVTACFRSFPRREIDWCCIFSEMQARQNENIWNWNENERWSVNRKKNTTRANICSEVVAVDSSNVTYRLWVMSSG